MKTWRGNDGSNSSGFKNKTDLTSEFDEQLENANEANVVNNSQSEVVVSPTAFRGIQITKTSKNDYASWSSLRKQTPARFCDYVTIDETMQN